MTSDGKAVRVCRKKRHFKSHWLFCLSAFWKKPSRRLLICQAASLGPTLMRGFRSSVIFVFWPRSKHGRKASLRSRIVGRESSEHRGRVPPFGFAFPPRKLRATPTGHSMSAARKQLPLVPALALGEGRTAPGAAVFQVRGHR